MVETNGLPNLSDGDTPDIHSLDYGIWAAELFDNLKIEKAFVAGASFGGLICAKLSIVSPEKIIAAFLLNPGCLQPFSLKLNNLYYNLLPILKPNSKNVLKFLDKAIFSKPQHCLSEVSQALLVDYELFAISRYKDNTQKPYYMDKELDKINVDIYLLEGEKDLLFPFHKSIKNVQKHINTLQEVKIFKNVGHGIETYKIAMNYIGEKIKNYR
ncbi:alpha/beta hydrolase [Flavobacterium psychroterrae]|uniref:Alpha/beta hydrolase n=1 Tax=Flavobacterium psychroterrae TaxID=2133767 RepID=A0ABS5PAI8_9FLAO|nr:alpha/beta hydrolase [Flavobacterium psychroterrae]MBS7231337.1 alpha/beta hydrolase [Flavobacterium psychroterrae]